MESALIVPRTLAGGSAGYNEDGYDPDKIAGGDVENALFWPLSVAEALEVNEHFRALGDHWWLRTPGYFNSQVAYVNNTGAVLRGGDLYSDENIFRPAFNLDLDPVIFTTAATGGKSTAVGSSLSAAGPVTGALKFTAANSAQMLEITAVDVPVSDPAASFNFSYKKATTGSSQFISCVLTDDSGCVKYYGKLKELLMPYDAIGTFSVSFAGVEDGTYTLKLFNEQINGDNYTDFCSFPVSMTLTVDGGLGAVSDYGDIPPSVVGITPSGSGVDISAGSLSITFNQPMDTSVAGSVTIDGATVSGPPEWSNNDQTVTYGLSGLTYGTIFDNIIIRLHSGWGGNFDILGSGCINKSGIVRTAAEKNCITCFCVYFNNLLAVHARHCSAEPFGIWTIGFGRFWQGSLRV